MSKTAHILLGQRLATRRWLRLALVGALVVGLAASLAAVARADGDPASDVLVAQSAFLPWDAGASAGQQAQLAGVLQAAARSGYRIRVAVIASRSDLGSVTALWRQPQSYAQFLGEELSLVFPGRVLVVMPDGFGLDGGGAVRPAEQAALTHARPSAAGVGLATAATRAVEDLAAASGHPLALAAVQAASPRPVAASGGSGVLPLIVFAVGVAVIAAAWTASLRARPLHLRGRAPSV